MFYIILNKILPLIGHQNIENAFSIFFYKICIYFIVIVCILCKNKQRLMQQLNWLIFCLQAPASYMGAGSRPSCFTSQLVCCLWPVKAAKDNLNPWDLAPTWETMNKLQVPGFSLLSSEHCSHWRVSQRMEDLSVRSLFLCNILLS